MSQAWQAFLILRGARDDDAPSKDLDGAPWLTDPAGRLDYCDARLKLTSFMRQMAIERSRGSEPPRCWMLTNSVLPEGLTYRPVGSALQSVIEKNRRIGSDWVGLSGLNGANHTSSPSVLDGADPPGSSVMYRLPCWSSARLSGKSKSAGAFTPSRT